MAVKIGLIGDLHYPLLTGDLIARRDARNRLYQTIFAEFLGANVDFHIAVGDVTHEGHEKEWLAIAGLANENGTARGRNFRFVLGNHDTLQLKKNSILTMMRQPRFSVEELQGARLILLDTTRESSPDHWGGLVDAEQIQWLESLADLPKTPTIVIGHHPFPSTTAGSEEPMMFMEDADRLTAALAAFCSPVIYCNGHNHVHSIAISTAKRNDWLHVQTAAVLSSPSFRILEIDEQNVSVKTHVLTDESVVNDAVTIRTDLPDYFHPESADSENDYEWTWKFNGPFQG